MKFKAAVDHNFFASAAIDGRIEMDSFVTHRMPLEKNNNVFELMHKGESTRAVIEF